MSTVHVRIRQDTSGYLRIPQDTSGYVSVRNWYFCTCKETCDRQGAEGGGVRERERERERRERESDRERERERERERVRERDLCTEERVGGPSLSAYAGWAHPCQHTHVSSQ